MTRATECTPWKILRRRPGKHRFYHAKQTPTGIYIHWRICKKPVVVGQVEHVPSRNICNVRVVTPEGKVVYRDVCRCAETGRRRVDNWLEGKQGWR